jgi:hypothetical protein
VGGKEGKRKREGRGKEREGDGPHFFIQVYAYANVIRRSVSTFVLDEYMHCMFPVPVADRIVTFAMSAMSLIRRMMGT